MKAFVTGATGFIGRHLAARLVEEGHGVISAGRSFDKFKASPIKKIRDLSDNTRNVYMDLEDKEAVALLLEREKPEVVFHCAASVDDWRLERLRRINACGTENVLEACLKAGVKKVVYLSSVSVISGNDAVPLTDELPYKANTAYGESKIEAEKIAINYRKKGLKIAILRPCMVYGEDEPHALFLLMKAIKRRILPVFGSGDKKIQLVSVENVVDIMILSFLKEEAYSGTYIVADKETLTVKELFSYMAKILGTKAPLSIPMPITLVLSKIPFIGKKIGLFLKDRLYDIGRLNDKLGYVPRISTYDGIREAALAHKRGVSAGLTKKLS